jgi:hypothetical protein
VHGGRPGLPDCADLAAWAGRMVPLSGGAARRPGAPLAALASSLADLVETRRARCPSAAI